MAKVLGLGGIFFKSPDPNKLNQWYSKWLGLVADGQAGVQFMPQDMPTNGCTVWSAFSDQSKYFAPSSKDFMFNFVVDNLVEALDQAREGGAQIIDKIEEHDYGKFGWFIDPDGNKIELWQPNN